MSDKPTPMFNLTERSPTAEELRRGELTLRIAKEIAAEEDGRQIRQWLRQERLAFVRKFYEHPNVLFVPEKARISMILWVRSQCQYVDPNATNGDDLILDGIKVMFVVDLLQPKVGYIHE